MGRPLRIEYPGALYHVTSRGNERRDIFVDDTDRRKFLGILEDYHDRYGILIHNQMAQGILSRLQAEFCKPGRALPVKALPFLLQISGLSELLVLLGFVWSFLGVVVTEMVTEGKVPRQPWDKVYAGYAVLQKWQATKRKRRAEARLPPRKEAKMKTPFQYSRGVSLVKKK